RVRNGRAAGGEEGQLEWWGSARSVSETDSFLGSGLLPLRVETDVATTRMGRAGSPFQRYFTPAQARHAQTTFPTSASGSPMAPRSGCLTWPKCRAKSLPCLFLRAPSQV